MIALHNKNSGEALVQCTVPVPTDDTHGNDSGTLQHTGSAGIWWQDAKATFQGQ